MATLQAALTVPLSLKHAENELYIFTAV